MNIALKDLRRCPRKLTAMCDVHAQACPVFPTPKDPHFKGMLMNVAGVTCVDWSQMSKHAGWLGGAGLYLPNGLQNGWFQGKTWL